MARDVSTIIIGTRGSDLALQQSQFVKDKIHALYPEFLLEIKIITTKGDKNSAAIPQDEVGKGWFTKEIEQELLRGDIDLAVHSLKDLPEVLPDGLVIGSYPVREDARDALVSKNGLSFKDLPHGAVMGTDSIRRKIQLLALRPDLQVKSIRGNVPTRLRKLEEETYDALILAAAGLKRLGLEKRIHHIFELDEMIPAPGQGVLAVEIRENDLRLLEVVKSINDASVQICARAERNFSRLVGGGCKQPVGAYAELSQSGKNISLHTMMAKDDDVTTIVKESLSGNSSEYITLSEEAAKKIIEKLSPA